jgi:hypothetical protein
MEWTIDAWGGVGGARGWIAGVACSGREQRTLWTWACYALTILMVLAVVARLP